MIIWLNSQPIEEYYINIEQTMVNWSDASDLTFKRKINTLNPVIQYRTVSFCVLPFSAMAVTIYDKQAIDRNNVENWNKISAIRIRISIIKQALQTANWKRKKATKK